MRVLHFCEGFSLLSETFIYDYITVLEQQGVDNYVVALERHNAAFRPFDKVCIVERPSRWFSSRLFYRTLAAAGLRARGRGSWPSLRRRLGQLIDRIAPDVIHAHFGPQGVLIAPPAAKLSIPLVVSFHGYDISKLPRENSWRSQYQQLWKSAAAVTVVSHRMREMALDLGCSPRRLHVVRVGRDAQIPQKNMSGAAIRKFVSVGRLVEKKGHLDAISAVHRLSPEYPDTHLTIVGDGDLKSEIERLIEELNCKKHVTLLGALQNDETLRLMAKSDAFLLCSKTARDGDQEGAPTVLLEAQLVGLPCISTRHAGIPETIPAANHRLLAAEGNVDEIVGCLRWLAEADKAEVEAIVQRGRSFVREHFDLKAQVEKLRSIYSAASELRHQQQRGCYDVAG